MGLFMFCPQCKSKLVATNPQESAYRCVDCGITTAADAVDQVPQDRDLATLSELLPNLPSVIALPLREYIDESRPFIKLWIACDTMELLLRLAVIVGLADIHRNGKLPKELVATIGKQIQRPTLREWWRMARTVAQTLQDDGFLPGVYVYLNNVLGPFLEGPPGLDNDERQSFIELRNRLAHGGGMRKILAEKLLSVWSTRFEHVIRRAHWLGKLKLVVKSNDGFGVLQGPKVDHSPFAPADAEALQKVFRRSADVVVVRGDYSASLSPLKQYGFPQVSGDAGPMQFKTATPLVYNRKGEVRLQFTPVGSDEACQSEGDDTALEEFRKLFRVDEADADARRKLFVEPGFDAEIQNDAANMVGRLKELNTLRSIATSATEGVYWVWGTAGIGKSYLMARLASELLGQAKGNKMILAYRFKAASSSRQRFLQFAIERLEPWLDSTFPEEATGSEEEKEERDLGRSIKPLYRLQKLIKRVAQLNAEHSSSSVSPRVIFVLDGLDEITLVDSRFAAEVPLQLAPKGVIWFCAGRPESPLPIVFGNTQTPFQNGLPPMHEDEIRGMLLENIELKRRDLLRKDKEVFSPDGTSCVKNTFINCVVKASQGLPLYVKYVISDINKGVYGTLDPGVTLPPSLDEYHERLLTRFGVGMLQQVLTPLAATLGAVNEPLSQNTLAVLLGRRGVVPENERGLNYVRNGLAAIATMIHSSPTIDGEDGYELCHASLRHYMRESNTMKDAVDLIRTFLSECALKWDTMDKTDPLRSYLMRQGPQHLYEMATGAEDDVSRQRWAMALVGLARSDLFRAEQDVQELNHPDLSLSTLRLAMLAGWDAGKGAVAAEFLMLYARSAQELRAIGPVRAARETQWNRAEALVNQYPSERRCLWWLLLFAEAKERGNEHMADRMWQHILSSQHTFCLGLEFTESAIVSHCLSLVSHNQADTFPDVASTLVSGDCSLQLTENLLSREQYALAITFAHSITDPRDKSDALQAIARKTPDATEAKNLLHHAAEEIRKMHPGPAKAAIMASLEDVAQAMKEAESLTLTWQRVVALTQIAEAIGGTSYSAQSLYDRAILLAHTMPQDQTDSMYESCLATLVHSMVRTALSVEGVERALPVADSITDSDLMSEALQTIATRFAMLANSESDFQRALAVIDRIETPYIQCGAFDTVACRMHEAGISLEFVIAVVGRAALIAKELEDDEEKANALSLGAIRVAEFGGDPMLLFQQSIEVAEGISNTGSKAQVLARIAEKLAAAKQDSKPLFERSMKIAEDIEGLEAFDVAVAYILEAMLRSKFDPHSVLQRTLLLIDCVSDRNQEVTMWLTLAQRVAEADAGSRPFFQQALSAAERVDDEYLRSQAVENIVTEMSKTHSDDIVKWATEIIRDSKDVVWQSKLMAASAERIVGDGADLDAVSRALLVANEIPCQTTKSTTLAAIAARTATAGSSGQEAFKSAIEAAETIKDHRQRVAALAEVGRRMQMAKTDPSKPFKQAIQTATHLSDGKTKSMSLLGIVEALAGDGCGKDTLAKASEIAEEIRDAGMRSLAFATIAEASLLQGADGQAIVDRALQAAKAITDASIKGRALAAISKQVVGNGTNPRSIDLAKNVADTIVDPAQQSQALATIALRIAGASDDVKAVERALVFAATVTGPSREWLIAEMAERLARSGVDVAAVQHASQMAEGLTDDWRKSEVLAAIAKRAATEGWHDVALATAGKLTSELTKHLPKIADAFAVAGDKAGFRSILQLCPADKHAALALCGSIIRLNPNEVANVVEVALKWR